MNGTDKVRKAFFILLRAGLWNIPPHSKEFPLTDEEWELLYIEARKQTVEGIICDGILMLSDIYMPSSALFLKWIVLADVIERRNQQMNRVIAKQYRAFIANGIQAILLKGQGVASCYEIPDHRICGDVDWYFPRTEDYKKAIELLGVQGIPVDYQPGFSASHLADGFVIEYHSRLIDIHNPFVAGYLKKLRQTEAAHTVYSTIADEQVALPSPVLTHLIINAHILKHMLAFGIGIRQLCDSARVCCRYEGSIDGEHLKDVYRTTGMLRWIERLHQLLVKELGMPAHYLPFPLSSTVESDWMIEDIWEGGNFGFYDDRFGTSNLERWKKRDNAWRHLARRFFQHVKYVPSEAFWFPVTQAYSRIFKR